MITFWPNLGGQGGGLDPSDNPGANNLDQPANDSGNSGAVLIDIGFNVIGELHIYIVGLVEWEGKFDTGAQDIIKYILKNQIPTDAFSQEQNNTISTALSSLVSPNMIGD